MVTSYETLILSYKNQLLPKHLENGISILEYPTPYNTLVFLDSSKNAFSLICTILGYEDDKIVYDNVLGFFLSLIPVLGDRPLNFDGCSFLPQEIHEKIEEFPSLELSRYPSYFLFMFIYHKYNIDKLVSHIRDLGE